MRGRLFSQRVARCVFAFEGEAETGAAEIGVEDAVDRINHSVEEEMIAANVIMKVFEMLDLRQSARRVQV